AHRQATTPRRAQILASTRERHPQLGQNLEREPPTLRLDQDSRPDLPTTQHISSTNSRRGTLGDGVTGFVIGDRVGVPWLASDDGTCRFCRRGQENLCEHPT